MSATHTTNLGLNKPDRQDYVSVVTDINDNMDILDSKIGAVPSGETVEGQIGAKVPTTRKINNKALSSDVTIMGSDIPMNSLDNTKLDVAVGDLKRAIAVENGILDGEFGYIDYKYDMPYHREKDNTKTNSEVLGITRTGQKIILDKTKTISNNIYLKLNGTMESTVYNTTVLNWNYEDAFSLEAGHVYKFTIRKTSGSDMSIFTNDYLGMSVYKAGTNSTIGEIVNMYDKGIRYRTFTAEAGATYHLALWISKNAIMDSMEFLVTLEDTSVYGNNINPKAPAIVKTAAGSVATFDDGAKEMQLRSLVVNVDPVQAGSGTPSPSNVRLISGWSGCNIFQEEEYDAQATPKVVQNWSDLIGYVYGAVINASRYGSAKISIGRKFVEFDGNSNVTLSAHGSTSSGESYPYYATFLYTTDESISADYTKWLFSHGLCQSGAYSGIFRTNKKSDNQISVVIGTESEITTSEGLLSYLAEQKTAETPLQVVYAINSPIIYNLDSIIIKTKLGQNNIWANTGGVVAEYVADTGICNSKHDARISDNNEDIDWLIGADKTTDDSLYHFHKKVNYGYDDYEKAELTTSNILGYKRYTESIILNKDTSANDNVRIHLNNAIRVSITNAGVDGWPENEALALKTGTTYKVTLKIESGSIANGAITVSVYRFGEHNNMANVIYKSPSGDYSIVSFTAEEDTRYNLAIWLSSTAICTNLRVLVLLEEISSIDPIYASEMNNTIDSVISLMTEPCLVFPLVTDIHCNVADQTAFQYQFKRTADNLKYFMGKIDCNGVICLGDITDGGYLGNPASVTAGIPFIEYVMESLKKPGKPLYFTIGNHDDFRYATPYMTANQIYQYYMRESDNNVIYDPDSYGTNYYKDFPGFKTRLISFNTNLLPTGSSAGSYGISSGTLQWVESVLADMPSDYIGMMITHVSIYYAITSAAHPYNITNGEAMRRVIHDSGKKCFVLNGHSHFDISYQAENDVLAVMVGCTKCEGLTTENITTVGGITGGVRYGRAANDETSDLWDVVVLRPFSKQLDLIRFGAGVDRHFSLSD